MAQKFTSKEQAMKHVGQFRCGMVALWLISMMVVGNFKNSDIAGFTGLIVTIAVMGAFYSEKKKVMEQIKAFPSSAGGVQNTQVINHTVTPSAAPIKQPQTSAQESKLINCPDCGKEVSRRTASCPNCGCPIGADTPISEPIVHSYPATDLNIPKCPTCQSTNVAKISLANKAGKVALVGVFAIGKVSKTFKCNACGYEW